MITKEDIERINDLSRKSRELELNDEEKIEQQALRRKYIDYIKSQVKVQLESIEYVEDKHSHHHHHHHPHKHDKN